MQQPTGDQYFKREDNSYSWCMNLLPYNVRACSPPLSCKEVLLAFMVVMVVVMVVVVVFVPSGLQTLALGCFVRTIISAVAASSRTTLLLIIITCEFKLARSKERIVGANAGPLAMKLWDPSVCFQRGN